MEHELVSRCRKRLRRGKDRIIVALDCATPEKVVAVATSLKDHVGAFKVGLELLTQPGTTIVPDLRKLGLPVFTDWKLADIPNTVGKATRSIVAAGSDFLTVHASAGEHAVSAAVKENANTIILGVTLLTSIEEEGCRKIFNAGPSELIVRLARVAMDGGAHGLVCAAPDLKNIMQHPELRGCLKITPGIRAADSPPDDQARTATPREAILAGADLLVIGRLVTDAPDPVAMAKRIGCEIGLAVEERDWNPTHDPVARMLFARGAVKFGEFELKAHAEARRKGEPLPPLSPVYLNLRTPENKNGPLLPEDIELIGELLKTRIEAFKDEFTCLSGIPEAGLPTATALHRLTDRRYKYLELKKVGTGDERHLANVVGGDYRPGDRVLVIDDLVADALTKEEAARVFAAFGINVFAFCVLVDRGHGGVERLAKSGYKTLFCFTLRGLTAFGVHHGLIPEDRYGLVDDYLEGLFQKALAEAV